MILMLKLWITVVCDKTFSETILFLLFLLLRVITWVYVFAFLDEIRTPFERCSCFTVSGNISRKSSGNLVTNVYFQQSYRHCLFILNNKFFGARSRLQKFHSDNNALWLPWTEIISLLALEFPRFSPVFALSSLSSFRSSSLVHWVDVIRRKFN